MSDRVEQHTRDGRRWIRARCSRCPHVTVWCLNEDGAVATVEYHEKRCRGGRK